MNKNALVAIGGLLLLSQLKKGSAAPSVPTPSVPTPSVPVPGLTPMPVVIPTMPSPSTSPNYFKVNFKIGPTSWLNQYHYEIENTGDGPVTWYLGMSFSDGSPGNNVFDQNAYPITIAGHTKDIRNPYFAIPYAGGYPAELPPTFVAWRASLWNDPPSASAVRIKDTGWLPLAISGASKQITEVSR